MPGGEVRNPSTKPPNKGLLESPLCTEHADYQAEFQQTRQKKELHAQINQRLTSKIHPGQSFPWRAAQLTCGSRRRCKSTALHGLPPSLGPLHLWDLVLSEPQEQVHGCPHPQNVLPRAKDSNCKGIPVFQAGKCCGQRHPGKRPPAALLLKMGRNQNNLIIQPLHSLKVQHIYSYKLMLNRLYFLFFFFSVSFYQQNPTSLSIGSGEGSPSASQLLQLVWVILHSVCLFQGLWDPCGILGARQQCWEGRRKTESWISCPRHCLRSSERGREKKEGQLCVANSPIPFLR